MGLMWRERDEWINRSITGLLGETSEREEWYEADNVSKKAAQALANRILDQNYPAGFNIESIREMSPLDVLERFNVKNYRVHSEVNDENRSYWGLVTRENGVWEIFLNPKMKEGTGIWRLVLAHEVGHVLVRMNNEGWPMSTSFEEDFCEAFAGSLLLPSQLIEPSLQFGLTISKAEEITHRLNIPMGLLVNWLRDNPEYLFRINKGLVVSENVRITPNGEPIHDLTYNPGGAGSTRLELPYKLYKLFGEYRHDISVPVETKMVSLGIKKADRLLLLTYYRELWRNIPTVQEFKVGAEHIVYNDRIPISDKPKVLTLIDLPV